MKLTRILAQKIVDKMMKDIPFNVNIMNEKGIIIASGEVERIGKKHSEACRVLQTKKILIYKQNKERGNVQPGINMPIEFRNRVIGVVGITGDPIHVKPFALLLKDTTELLLEQRAFQESEESKAKKLTRFLFRWTQKDIDTDTVENLKREALDLNIDFYQERTVVVIKCSHHDLMDLKLSQQDFHLNRSVDTQVMICHSKKSIQACLDYAHQRGYRVAVGMTGVNVGRSFFEAQTTLYFANLLQEDYHSYGQVYFLQKILESSLNDDAELLKKFSLLENTSLGTDLLETLLTYFKNNGNMSQTALKLHIHRNTLLYRLAKIKELMGLDPHNFVDLFQLYAALLTYLDSKNRGISVLKK